MRLRSAAHRVVLKADLILEKPYLEGISYDGLTP
jgi:hypothetical protein